MMYLLSFNHLGKKYLLHNGEQFRGGNTYEEAKMEATVSLIVSIPVGGLEVVQMSVEELRKAIGGVPYPITDFTGGFGKGWMGVQYSVA